MSNDKRAVKKLDIFSPEVLERAKQIKANMPRGFMRDMQYVSQALSDLQKEQEQKKHDN